MKIDQTHIDKIRESFAAMQNKEDLVNLLSEAKNMLYAKECNPVTLKALTYYANPEVCKKRYQTFTIKKKSGADRTIHAPVKGLKSILRALNLILQCIHKPHEAATGFVLDKSIVDNAKRHVGQQYVLNLDLKDFFHSFDLYRVKTGLFHEIWGIKNIPKYKEKNESDFKCIEEIAFLIACLCTHPFKIDGKEKTVLPQGSPTSPILTNILCEKLDRRLTGLANRFGATYTRYADDITFSSPHNIYSNEAFNKEIKRIIEEDQKLIINVKKTRLQKAGHRQEATGLIVNEKVNVRRRYVKQIRMWLYYWEKYGYEKAEQIFKRDYGEDKSHVKKGEPNIANVLDGKLEFLKMVKGVDNELYLKLKGRFNSLTIVNKPLEEKIPSISPVNIFSIVGFENLSINTEEANQQNTKRLRININPIDSGKGQNKLKRQIIIKKGESLPHEELLENKEEEEKEINLSKHKPLDVSKFLKYFQNGKLKWLTHKFDEGPYNRSVIIQEANDEFLSLTRSLVIQPALYGRVNWFGFVSNLEKFYYLNKFHYTNWHSHNVLKWELENPNMHPINSDLLFLEMFGPFKKSIELKDKDLKNLISNQLVSSLGGLYTSFNFEYNDLDNVNFYTDVDALKRGLSYLFNSIKQRSENGLKVKFNYRRVSDIEGRKRILEIIHINSSCNKSLEKTELFKGDLLAAEKALFGICDWSIISKSPDNSVNKLNVLFDINSNKMPKEKIDDSLIEGFMHVLTFYA